MQATVGEELAQGTYVAARMQGTEPTTEPSCPTNPTAVFAIPLFLAGATSSVLLNLLQSIIEKP